MKLLSLLTTTILSIIVTVSAMAQDHGSKDEAQSMAREALVHIKKVGNEQAFKDFTIDKVTWLKKDLYISVQDFSGVVLFHGVNQKMIGRNFIDLKDQNGKLIAREMIEVAKKGEGWVDYDFTNPVSKKIEAKSSFVKRIPDFDGYVIVGAYR